MQKDIFFALADPTRRDILDMLRHSDRNLAEISGQFDMSRPAVSKHIKILERADLVHIETQGRHRIHRLNPDGLRPVHDWLRIFDQFWDEKLGSLKTLIEGEHP